MSGQLRTLKNRIRSVENTKKITRAMEMVAAAKLNRFMNILAKSRPYAEGLEKMVGRLMSSQSKNLQHPFFSKRVENKIGLLIFTSDTGLCGSYNSDLVQSAKGFIEKSGKVTAIAGIGKSGVSALQKKGHSIQQSWINIKPSGFEAALSEITSFLETLFLSGALDSIYVVYGHAIHSSLYQTKIEKLLPFETPAVEKGKPFDYIIEPSQEELFDKLVPAYFESKLRRFFLEAFVSEQIARMSAMHQATKNAKEMIESLVLARNKARQAAITKELIEIVSGSKALKR